MRKKILTTAVILVLCLIIIGEIFISGHVTNSHNKMYERSEGVFSLYVPFSRDYSDFNVSLAQTNLTALGYSPEGKDKIYGSDWYIRVKWDIPDQDYREKYISDLTVEVRGYAPNETSRVRSSILVSFIPEVVAEPPKKDEDKVLAKQAAFEIAAIIGVPLDWNNHTYTIGWMTMTSDGYYDESVISLSFGIALRDAHVPSQISDTEEIISEFMYIPSVSSFCISSIIEES